MKEKKAIGILAFTNQEVLNHKLKDGKLRDGYCFWEMGIFPKKFMDVKLEECRLYLAVKGQVKGYFVIYDMYFEDKPSRGGEIDFHSDSWVEIKDGEILKPSQGWRYYLHINNNK